MYSVNAYWTPATQVQNLGGTVQTTFDLSRKHIVHYQLCTTCVDRTMKFNKIFRYIIGSIFTIITGSLPVIYSIERIFNVELNSGVTETWMPILLFIVAIGIAGYTFSKRDPEETKNKTIDSMLVNRLNNEILTGKIAEAARLRRKNVRVYVWTELTKKQK